MEKVKLPRDVAEAMDGVKEHADESLLYNVQYMHDVCENEKFDAPKFQPIYNWIQRYGHKEYFRALVNGYEVEETPEYKVRITFEYVLEQIDKLGDHPQVEHWKGMKTGIITTLGSLDIKIKGVNE